jgi:phosphoglycerate dehydrogenase-like enzyme
MPGMSHAVVAISSVVNDEVRTATLDVLNDESQVVFLQDQQPAARAETLRDAAVLVASRVGRDVSPEELAQAKRLRLVQFLSAGADGIDFTAISPDVVIADNAGAYAKPMAEHVMAMALALAKRLPQRHTALAAGEFDQQTPNLTLDGAVCGILGFGAIGTATAALMRAFGARIHAVNSSGHTTEPVEFVGTLADLDAVLTAADVLVIALPLTRTTRGLIGSRELALMKPEAVLVNVARAGIIVEAGLYGHLEANRDFTAGIDVWWHEPIRGMDFRPDHPFLELPNVIGSPHDSAIVTGSHAFAARHAAENVRRYLRGEPAAGVVRREDYVEP